MFVTKQKFVEEIVKLSIDATDRANVSLVVEMFNYLVRDLSHRSPLHLHPDIDPWSSLSLPRRA